MKRFLIYILLLVPLLFTVSCPKESKKGEGREIIDANGRRVTVPLKPERVVFAGRASIMLMNALYLFEGVDERIVGVGISDQGRGDFHKELDPHWKERTKIEGKIPSVDAISALSPDLIFLKNYMKETGSLLESVGLTVVYLDLESYSAFQKDIENLGVIFDQQPRAEEIIGYYNSKLDFLATYNYQNSFLILSASKGGASFEVSPNNWLQREQVSLSGSTPVWRVATASSGWNQVSFEQIAAWNPNYILIVSYRESAEEIVANIRDNPLWQELQAVREGRLFPFPADYYSWSQPDTRWILGALWIASLQDNRGGIRMEEEVYTFFQTLYKFSDRKIKRIIDEKGEGFLF